MSDEKYLQQAKQLIQQKEYDKARQILRRMPTNQTAQKWLVKLDDIAPASTRSSSRSPGLTFISLIIALLMILGAFAAGRLTAVDSEAQDAKAVIAIVAPTLTQLAIPPTETAIATLTPIATETPTISCNPETWYLEAEPLITEFFDISETAAATSRAALSGVILELNQTYREFERLDYPDCVQGTRDNLASGMNYAVDGFNAFLGSDSQFGGEYYFSEANKYFLDASNQLSELNLSPDTRMTLAYVLIWGGDDPLHTRTPFPTSSPTLTSTPTITKTPLPTLFPDSEFVSITLYISTSIGVPVYSAPDAHSGIIGRLEYGDSFLATSLEDNGFFYCFDFNGQRGCVYRSSTSETLPQ